MTTTCLTPTAARPQFDLRAKLGALISRISTALDRYSQQRLARAAFKNMLTLDDAMLDDIGVTRAEVEKAAGLPLEANAARSLKEIARQRRSSRLF